MVKPRSVISTMLAISVVTTLTACAMPFIDASARARPTKCVVNVYVDDDGQVLIDHEPVRTKACGESEKVVTWSLQPGSGVYTFAPTTDTHPGIEFPAQKNPSPPATPNCSRPNDYTYRCKWSGASGYKWTYAINVLKNGVAFKTLDPTVFND